MSLENRSNSALFKRAEQLKRWEQSETNREPPDPKQISKRIKFSADCVFLAACAAGDKDEVVRLLQKGADINTGNVDGLTALHQACIDDDLDMVEFLVEQGADINRGDNEGWTPLHATASCGFISIAKYLIEQGCNLAAVNNDGELALDIAESDEMEEMLQEHINKAGIDCKQARSEEERLMMTDARAWKAGAPGKDSIHPRSGATALHVAAAKGYSTVMSILLQARCDVNARDNDGWTPLHAAAHWGQIDACKLLVENFCDMDIKNYAGQTAFDIADSDIVKALEELKKKQEVLIKDHPQIINKQQAIPKKRVSTNKENSVDQEGTEAYEEETPNKVKKVELEIQSDKEESSVGSNSDVEKKNRVNREETGSLSPQASPDKVTNQAPIIPPKQQIENNEDGNVPSWRRSGSLRTRGVDNESVNTVPAKVEEREKVIKTPLSPSKVSEEPEVVLRRTHSFETDEKKKDIKLNLELARVPQSNSTQSVSSLNDRKSLPATPVSANLSAVTSPTPVNQIRRSFVPPVRDEESETQRKAHAKRVRETRRSTQGVTLDEIKSAEQLVKKKQQQSNDVLGSTATTTTASSTQPLSSSTTAVNNNNSSSNSNSNSNSINNSNSHGLANNNSGNGNGNGNNNAQPMITATITTASPTTTVLSNASKGASAAATDSESNQPERRPSWRLKVDAGSKFQLEDANNRSSNLGSTDTTTAYIRRPVTTNASTRPSSAPIDSGAVQTTAETTVTLPLRRPVKPAEDKEQDKENDSRNAQATQAVIQRRRRPKRRSTGVVHVDMDEIDPEKQDGTSGDGDDSKVNHTESGHDRSGRSSRLGSMSSLSSEGGTSLTRSKSLSGATSTAENGELDYKKLYEESQVENERLREKLRKSDEQLKDTQSQLEKAHNASQSKLALSETEKRERRAMERKLSEMEEELKQLQKLKAENERLKAENRALTRVVSKLTNTAK